MSLSQTPVSADIPQSVGAGPDPAAADSSTAAAERTQTPGEYDREAESRESDELWQHIESRSVTPRPDCAIWTGATDRGYGRISVDGQVRRVHRVAWELRNGPIPDGLTIDHLCRVPMCCNTDHMELVTAAENSRRAAASRALEATEKRRLTQSRRAVVRPIAPPRSQFDLALHLMDNLIVPVGDHWVWVGYTEGGRARFQVGEQRGRPHRLLWEVNNGPLGKSALNATCEMDLCCNPDHQSLRGSSARRTHCTAGHELTSENLYEYPEHGIRTCRKCASAKAAERYRRKKAA